MIMDDFQFEKEMLSFGNEKEILAKLIALIKNPPHFFEVNKDNEKQVMDVGTFIVRLIVITNFILFLKQGNIILTSFLLVFIFARFFTLVIIGINATLLNFFVKLFCKKDDIHAADRVAAYTLITGIIPDIWYLRIVGLLVAISLEIIGISKQYKISIEKSFLAVMGPLIILATFGAVLFTIVSI